uniref:Transmembrane protein n=1 Tax=Haptolina brevifila TaxID=156173 RepID=A0A7S2D7V1_9EUKA
MIGWSIVVFIAAMHVVVPTVRDGSSISGEAIWALIVSIVTFRDASFMLVMEMKDRTRKASSVLLVIVWLITVVVTTIDAPFTMAGNGFFAVWLGLTASCVITLEEFEKNLANSPIFNAAAVYAISGLVLWVETAQYIGHPSYEQSYAIFALVYGLITMLFGWSICELLLYREETTLFYHWSKLTPCMQNIASALFDGPSQTVFDIVITPLKCIALFVTAFAVAAALALTYYFPPYTTVDNGYLAAWASVIAAAFLMTEDAPPKVSRTPTRDELAVITTISGDVEAAQLGVPDARGPAYGGHEQSSFEEAPAPEPATPRVTVIKAPHKWPTATMLGLSSFLLILAAAHMLSDECNPALNPNTTIPAGCGMTSITATTTANGISTTEGEKIWAIVVGGVSILALVLRAILLYSKGIKNQNTLWWVRVCTAALLALSWLAAALVLTFVGPFLDTGNGYFAAWAGLICAVSLFLEETAAPVEE